MLIENQAIWRFVSMILKLKLFCQKVLLHMEVHKTSEEPLNFNPSSQYLTLLFIITYFATYKMDS